MNSNNDGQQDGDNKDGARSINANEREDDIDDEEERDNEVNDDDTEHEHDEVIKFNKMIKIYDEFTTKQEEVEM